MAFAINRKVKIPEENVTKMKILEYAKAYGCYVEARKIYEKYENWHNEHKLDENAAFQMAKSMIKELGDLHIGLVIWLADEHGDIRVNNVVAYTIVDMPEEKD